MRALLPVPDKTIRIHSRQAEDSDCLCPAPPAGCSAVHVPLPHPAGGPVCVWKNRQGSKAAPAVPCRKFLRFRESLACSALCTRSPQRGREYVYGDPLAREKSGNCMAFENFYLQKNFPGRQKNFKKDIDKKREMCYNNMRWASGCLGNDCRAGRQPTQPICGYGGIGRRARFRF